MAQPLWAAAAGSGHTFVPRDDGHIQHYIRDPLDDRRSQKGILKKGTCRR